MHWGLKIFSNKKINEFQLRNLIKKIERYSNIALNKFEFSEMNTEKTKKVIGIEKAVQFLSDVKYFSLSVNSSNSDFFRVYANIQPRSNCTLSFDVNIEIFLNDNMLFNDSFFNLINTVDTYYGFAVYNNDHNRFIEELSFIPISNSWLTRKSNAERENYLFSLQDKRYGIGKIIAQIYPVNYFLTSENISNLKNLKNKLNSNWIFEENGDYTIVKYKQMIPWEEFEKIKNSIKLD